MTQLSDGPYAATAGHKRCDVPYRWPTTLTQPARPPQLVYLDLNHWIYLAKALSGHPDGVQYVEAFEACLRAVADGRAVFPISSTTVMEVNQIGQHRQRVDIRRAIEAISEFRVIGKRGDISVHEIETMLDEVVGPSSDPINTLPYLDWGVARAFGMIGGFSVFDGDGEDTTEQVRAEWEGGPEAYDEVMRQAELQLQRSVLDGPSPEELPEMEALGWDPAPAIAMAEQRARQEQEQVERFNSDPTWRQGRIRDVVSAREMLIEINETLSKGVADRGVDPDEVFTGPEAIRPLFDAMPSLDVAVSMKTSYHRDPNRRWKRNDTYDIDALGSAVPYCDIVVTDREAAAHVNRTGLAERLDTTVINRLAELPDLL